MMVIVIGRGRAKNGGGEANSGKIIKDGGWVRVVVVVDVVIIVVEVTAVVNWVDIDFLVVINAGRGRIKSGGGDGIKCRNISKVEVESG